MCIINTPQVDIQHILTPNLQPLPIGPDHSAAVEFSPVKLQSDAFPPPESHTDFRVATRTFTDDEKINNVCENWWPQDTSQDVWNDQTLLQFNLLGAGLLTSTTLFGLVTNPRTMCLPITIQSARCCHRVVTGNPLHRVSQCITQDLSITIFPRAFFPSTNTSFHRFPHFQHRPPRSADPPTSRDPL